MLKKYFFRLINVTLSVICYTGQASTTLNFIKILHQPYCLDVWRASYVIGTKYIIFPCHGHKNQTFYMDDSGRITPFMGPNFYMTFDASTNALRLDAFNDKNLQKFYMNKNSHLQIKGTNLCIKANYRDKATLALGDADLSTVPCTSPQALKWHIYHTDFSNSQIQSQTGFCFGLTNGGQKGSVITSVTCDKNAPRWNYDYTSGKMSPTENPLMCLGLSQLRVILTTCDQAEPFDFVDGIGLRKRQVDPTQWHWIEPDSTTIGSLFSLSQRPIFENVAGQTSVISEPVANVRKVTKH